MKEEIKEERCLNCGSPFGKKNRTGYCRRCYLKCVEYPKRKLRRIENKRQHKCIDCKAKIKPVYKIRCKRCLENVKLWKEKRLSKK